VQRSLTELLVLPAGIQHRRFTVLQDGVPDDHGSALEQVLKANSSLRRHILMLERCEGRLQSQLKLQKRTISSIEDEVAGARRLVLVAEERFQQFERRIEALRSGVFKL
jgi:hypothetical protein